MSENQNAPALLNKIKTQEELLNNYRKLIGGLALNKDKNNAWSVAKAWAAKEFWFSIGSDLKTEAEQQAFLFK